MSTEATGGGQPGAEGTAEPEAAAEETEPTSTTLAAPTAWDTTAPSAWGTSVAANTGNAEPAALVPEQAAPVPEQAAPVPEQAVTLGETASEAGSDPVADEAPAPAAPSPAGEVPGDAAAAGEVPGDAAAASEAQAAAADEAVLDAAGQVTEPAEPAEPEDSGQVSGSEAADDPDEAAAYDGDSDDYADDETAADGAEYGEYEPGEAARPLRARRWPRVLLALGFVVLAAVIVGGASAIVGSITHGFTKPVKITYKESALFSLKTGECFDPRGQSYSLISCDSPHQAEVFATFTLSGTKYPGATAIAAQASDGCTNRLTGYVNPQLALSLTSTYVYPDSVAWQAGTKTVICEVRASNGTLTGSVRSASAR